MFVTHVEGSLRMQNDIDVAYDGWCDIVRGEMYGSLPYKSATVGVRNKKRRPGKPWWTDTLTNMWNDACRKETLWLKCNSHSEKVRLKAQYCIARKSFDKEVQRSKRLFWFNLQS